MKVLKLLLIYFLINGILTVACGQTIKFNTRYSYYTDENRAEFLLAIPPGYDGRIINIWIGMDNRIVFDREIIAAGPVMSLTIPLAGLDCGIHPVMAWITVEGNTKELKSILVRLAPKANGVQIDRLTGKLLVNGLPFFPFGFYCYSPVQPTLAEEEAVKGFNLMSPYQTIDPKTFADREAYMDRCARLGMKVHYQLISVAGGGGVGSSRLSGVSSSEKMNRLKAEIEHFRDHPALLAWYLSDEPTGHGATPDSLQKLYEFIKELDPYHPVTIVFMAPQRAREYAAAMDIVMADPYPVPNSGVEGVGSVAESLYNVFAYEKPVWIVPQAFGGGEHWGREPSPAEIRAMTYLSLVRGATGIQYFIRHGPNGFPKSHVTWGECGRMAMEVAQLTPYLLDGIPIPEMMRENGGIWSNAWRLGDEILVMAVNAENRPQEVRLDLPAGLENQEVEVLFENRIIKSSDGQLTDWIAPMGSMVYRVGGKLKKPAQTNLLLDPGFEGTMSFGAPSACYARVGTDRGATSFLDARDKKAGYHSLRMTTPTENLGMGLSFFPVSLNSGQSYCYTIWARADTASWLPGPRPSFFARLFGKKVLPVHDFKVMIGNLANHRFILEPEWKAYSFYFTLPEQGNEQVKLNPYLELTGQGVAWFDEMVLQEDPVLEFNWNDASKRFEISISTVTDQVDIRYNLEGRKPGLKDLRYEGPFSLDRTSTVAAGLYDGNTLIAWTTRTFKVHKAMGRELTYQYPYSSRYNGGGSLALVDGISGSRNYLDGRWQGFMGRDLDVKIDLGSSQPVSRVSIGCLQDISSWIFMPLKLTVEGSADGENYTLFGETANTVDPRKTGAIRQLLEVSGTTRNIRYLRVRASNMRICPDWHNGKGQAAYIFVDEVSVE